MPDISVVSHYYNCPDKVLKQISYWESLPVTFLSRVEFILVDDCSEQSLVIPATKLDLKVFRITTDISWNQPGARNLGAFNATGDWCLFFDIDQKFYIEPMTTVLDAIGFLDNMTMYFFLSTNADYYIMKGFPNHQNTFLVNSSKFRIHGMYDEDFSGHYAYDDCYLNEHWRSNGGKTILLTDFDYFMNMGFGTEGLDRDASRNKLLGQTKMLAGTGNSPGILRFDWEQVPVPEQVPTSGIGGALS